MPKGSAVCCKDKTGIFMGTTIQCDCCRFEFSPSKWERHAGSTRHRPWQSICIASTGKSLLYYKQKYDPSPSKKMIVVDHDPITQPLNSQINQPLLEQANETEFSNRCLMLPIFPFSTSPFSGLTIPTLAPLLPQPSSFLSECLLKGMLNPSCLSLSPDPFDQMTKRLKEESPPLSTIDSPPPSPSSRLPQPTEIKQHETIFL